MTKKRRRGTPLTRRALAARIDVHAETVTKWVRAGMPVAVPSRGGRPAGFDELAVRKWRARRAAAAHAGDPAKARARRDLAQALLAEQLLAARARGLLPADEVEKAWSAEVSAIRAALLSWSTTIADKLHRAATLEGRPGVERELHAATRQVLVELSAPDRATPCPHCGKDVTKKEIS